MNQFSRNVALWLVLGLMILLLFNLLTRQQPKLQDISFSNFMAAVEKAKSLDSDKIVKVLETTPSFNTIAGPFRFTHNNHFNNSGTVTILQYKNGQAHFLKLVKPTKLPPVKY